MADDKLTMLVPPHVKATVRGPFGEGKVTQIPMDEFTDAPLLVSAENFPARCPQCGGTPDAPASDPVNGPRVPCCDPIHREGR